MGVPIYQVDAFTAEAFTGNPAAVCILQAPADETWMQKVAAEMNLSETAFALREGPRFRLRWFTPACEVDLCGHATLATAHVLWEAGMVPGAETVAFLTKSGELKAARRGTWIELDFPAAPGEPVTNPPRDLARVLGVASPVYVSLHRWGLVVEVDNEREVRDARPDFRALAGMPFPGFMITSGSESPRFDFVSRFFGPGVGIDEDPVTGAAHCCLGPYWRKRLGKSELVGYQASARGGVVRVSVGEERVRLGGQAVTVMHGALV